METHDVANLKMIVSVGAKLGNIAGMAFQDGKINKDDLNVIPEFLKVFPILIAVDWKLIVPEVKDLSEAEQVELVEWFKSEFDIPQDNIEVTVEQALSLINLVVSFIMGIIKAFKKN